ncbi:uncharacterized protein LOC144302962 isoform X6 [Canis aureus]
MHGEATTKCSRITLAAVLGIDCKDRSGDHSEKIALLWPRQESGTSLKYLRNTKSPIKGASGVIEGESEEKGHRESTEQVICEEPREAAILT